MKLNLFKREEVKQPENEAEKEKEMLILKDSLSSPEKEEFRNQLISLMVPIISWKEFPNWVNSEWAISIVKRRHIIEDLKLKYPSLDENYIDDIWVACFKRAKHLVRAEMGTIKKEKVDNLTYEDVFEYDYSLSINRSSYLQKTLFGKNLPIFMTLFASILALSIALFNLNLGILYREVFAGSLFLFSILGIAIVCIGIVVSIPVLRLIPAVIYFLLVMLLGAITTGGFSQQPKSVTPAVPQSSPAAKPSPSPKPSTQQPPQNSQNISPRGNK